MAKKVDQSFKEFNKFQSAFYTSIVQFKDFSRFEVKRNGYILLNNMAKGYPALADIFLNCSGIDWKAVESPAVLQALQRKFVNGFNSARLPQFVFHKGSPTKKTQKEKAVKTKKGLIFSQDIINEICSKLIIDSKTYDYFKFDDKIQFLGKQLAGDFQQKGKLKKTRTTKK